MPFTAFSPIMQQQGAPPLLLRHSHSNLTTCPARTHGSPYWRAKQRRWTSRQWHMLQRTAATEDQPGSTSTIPAARTPVRQLLWGSHVSRRINLDLAIADAVEGALESAAAAAATHSLAAAVDAAAPELAIVFASSAFADEYEWLVRNLRSRLPSLRHVIGCSGYGVIGSTTDGQPLEVEHLPALSLTVATLPGTIVSLNHVVARDLPDGDAPPSAWASLLGVTVPVTEQPHAASSAATSSSTDSSDSSTPDSSADDNAVRASTGAGASTSSSTGTRDSSNSNGSSSGSSASSTTSTTSSSSSSSSFIVIGDPTFTKLEELLAGLDFAFPAAAKVGGLASAGRMSSDRAMFGWSHDWASETGEVGIFHMGALVLSLQGSVSFELIMAQGCRPLNDNTYTIHRLQSSDGGRKKVVSVADARGGVIAPVEALQQDLMQKSKERVEMTRLLSNLTLGLAPDTLKSAAELEPIDFLIRGCGFERGGAMVVGDAVRVGQRFRFMVRDCEGAKEDLQSHLMAHKRRAFAASMSSEAPASTPFGMLVFSCNGRGSDLYGEHSYDSRMLASFVPVPCNGFMCNGEIGTVSGSTKLHGFTCAVAVLRASPTAFTAADDDTAASDADVATESAAGGGDAAVLAAQQQQRQQESSTDGDGHGQT